MEVAQFLTQDTCENKNVIRNRATFTARQPVGRCRVLSLLSFELKKAGAGPIQEQLTSNSKGQRDAGHTLITDRRLRHHNSPIGCNYTVSRVSSSVGAHRRMGARIARLPHEAASSPPRLLPRLLQRRRRDGAVEDVALPPEERRAEGHGGGGGGA